MQDINSSVGGCDEMSVFRGRGKNSAWQAWKVCPKASDIFFQAQQIPTDSGGL